MLTMTVWKILIHLCFKNKRSLKVHTDLQTVPFKVFFANFGWHTIMCIWYSLIPKPLRGLRQFEKHLNVLGHDSGTLASFWISYIDIVSILLQLLWASRDKNWGMHLSAIYSMIPWCFAYNKVNYAPYLPVYYPDMVNLPDETIISSKRLHDLWILHKFHGQPSGICAIQLGRTLFIMT